MSRMTASASTASWPVIAAVAPTTASTAREARCTISTRKSSTRARWRVPVPVMPVPGTDAGETTTKYLQGDR